jgi:AmmeMemoRadiSam system protein A
MTFKNRQRETHSPASQIPTASETPARTDRAAEGVLTGLARLAVETFVRRGHLIDAPAADSYPALLQPAPCFVCIKTLDRRLRGCIGTVEPSRPTLADEIVVNAIGAATRDRRFRPVTADELASVFYTVDVLDTPEPAQMEDLDPKRFGVIVENADGSRRGLLLPDIDGVETVGRQIEIAARKAGLPSHAPLKLYRFRVRRYKEPARAGMA